MDNLPYNPNSVESIFNYSQKLVGMSFKEILDTNTNIDDSDRAILYEYYNNIYSKGSLGNLVEEHFFFYKPNSDQDADFKEAGVELKVTPYVKNKNRYSFSKRKTSSNND